MVFIVSRTAFQGRLQAPARVPQAHAEPHLRKRKVVDEKRPYIDEKIIYVPTYHKLSRTHKGDGGVPLPLMTVSFMPKLEFDDSFDDNTGGKLGTAANLQGQSCGRIVPQRTPENVRGQPDAAS